MVLNRLSDGMRRPRRTLNKSVQRKIKDYNDTDTTCKHIPRFTRATRNHVVLVYACRSARELCTYVRQIYCKSETQTDHEQRETNFRSERQRTREN